MKTILVALFLLTSTLSVPTNFDLRVQTERAKYTDYDLQPEGICAGYAWAKELAQVISNAVGLYEQQKVALSAQQILDCTQSETDICYKATLENIQDAISKISNQGITTQYCYRNKPFTYPNGFCRRQCHDGSRFPFTYYPKFNKYYKFTDLINVFRNNEDIAALAVIKVDNAFNYYSPFRSMLTPGGPKEMFEFRVAEVVGWKNAQTKTKVILRAGPGQQWGYNGFIDLQLDNFGKYIVQYYSVELSDRSTLQAE